MHKRDTVATVGLLFEGLATQSFPVIPTMDIESGKSGWVDPRALDQEAFAFQPFDDGRTVHDQAGKGRMRGIGSPRAYQAVELFKDGFARHENATYLHNGA